MPIVRDAPVRPIPYPAQYWRRGQHGDWIGPWDAAEYVSVDIGPRELGAVRQKESNVFQQLALGEAKT